jgi:hypothetical protein
MYRLATLLTLLIALAAAGCGGSGDDSDSAPSAVAQAPSGDDSAGSPASDSAKKENGADEKTPDDEADDKAGDGAGDDDEPKTHEEQHEAAEEAFEKLPLETKEQLLETTARNALLRFGLKMADAELRNRGRSATVVVSEKGACNFVASQEPNLALTIRQGVPGLKSVRFEMAGTGEQLGYYVLGCERPEIPSGAGRVVLDHGGVGGPYKSKRFKITSERWALEWVNEGASLAVIVQAVGGESKENETYFKPVGSQKPESGRFEYKGKGTFQINAYGAGGWRVRVKEIG